MEAAELLRGSESALTPNNEKGRPHRIKPAAVCCLLFGDHPLAAGNGVEQIGRTEVSRGPPVLL